MSSPYAGSSPGHSTEIFQLLEFEDTRIHLNIPSEELGSRALTDLLRLFEILIAFRAISPFGNLGDHWHSDYRRFLQTIYARSERNSQRSERENLRSFMGARGALFEVWLQRHLQEKQLLPIERIDLGSYEFVFSVVNLVTIFGLQDYGFLKDTVQWVVGELKSLMEFTPDEISDPYTTKQTRGDKSETIRSGPSTAILLTPEVIRELRGYDSVEFLEETKPGSRRLRIKLVRHQKDKL